MWPYPCPGRGIKNWVYRSGSPVCRCRMGVDGVGWRRPYDGLQHASRRRLDGGGGPERWSPSFKSTSVLSRPGLVNENHECSNLPAVFSDSPLAARGFSDSHETVQRLLVIEEVGLVLLRERNWLLRRYPARFPRSRFLDRRLHSSYVSLRPAALHRHGVAFLVPRIKSTERNMIVVPLGGR